MNSIIIALDVDQTYTQDPEFWDKFIEMAQIYEHEVICVTSRKPGDIIHMDNLFEILGEDKIFFTSGKPKMNYMEGKHHVDVWIDDLPGHICGCKMEMYRTDESRET